MKYFAKTIDVLKVSRKYVRKINNIVVLTHRYYSLCIIKGNVCYFLVLTPFVVFSVIGRLFLIRIWDVVPSGNWSIRKMSNNGSRKHHEKYPIKN